MKAEPATIEYHSHRWLHIAIAGLIFLACANVIARRMVDPDLWGHIQYGEDWIAEGALPRTASHTYADPNYTWINHENISELALAFGHRWFGGIGLMIGKTLLALGLFWSMFACARRRNVDLIIAAACLFPVAGGMAEFWCARPQLASFIGMALMLIVFDRAFRDWNDNRNVNLKTLWFVPLIMFVWTNSHGGFLAGAGVLCAYLGVRCAEALWFDRGKAWNRVFGMSIVVVASLGVTLLNPYGLGLHQWLLRSLGQPRPEISEWVSIPDSGVTIIPFTILVVLTLGAYWLTTKRRDPAQMIVILLVAIQTFMHCRHLPFLALMFGFWLPMHIQSAFERWQTSRVREPQQPFTRGGILILKAECALIAFVLIIGLVWQFANFGVKRDKYPVSAIEFMSEHNLQGRIVVTFNWAQYTLAALPESLVSFDGRFRTCYSQEVVDMNFDLTVGEHPHYRNRATNSEPVDPTRVLEFGNPDLVLIDRQNNVPAVNVMSKQDDWTLLYQDSLSQLFGRASQYDDPSHAKYIAPESRSISDEQQSGIASWPAMPERSGKHAFVVTAAKRTCVAVND